MDEISGFVAAEVRPRIFCVYLDREEIEFVSGTQLILGLLGGTQSVRRGLARLRRVRGEHWKRRTDGRSEKKMCNVVSCMSFRDQPREGVTEVVVLYRLLFVLHYFFKLISVVKLKAENDLKENVAHHPFSRQ